MQTRYTNSRPSDIPVQKAKERQRNSEEECLKAGNWPVSKSELTNKNLMFIGPCIIVIVEE